PVFYVIGFIALWFHMTHGFWSMFQSCGWNGQIWLQRTKCIANWWTSIVVCLFIIEAIVFTVNANQGNYTACPVLQEQYIEMASEGNNACCESAQATCCVGAECEESACTENTCCGAEVEATAVETEETTNENQQ
ncbi:MAG: hypothetical protein K2J42_04470, partial [Muribaculaceae bacterium]|nr:hypothetical protein [Muribaculaceae bacterium]